MELSMGKQDWKRHRYEVGNELGSDWLGVRVDWRGSADCYALSVWLVTFKTSTADDILCLRP